MSPQIHSGPQLSSEYSAKKSSELISINPNRRLPMNFKVKINKITDCFNKISRPDYFLRWRVIFHTIFIIIRHEFSYQPAYWNSGRKLYMRYMIYRIWYTVYPIRMFNPIRMLHSVTKCDDWNSNKTMRINNSSRIFSYFTKRISIFY